LSAILHEIAPVCPRRVRKLRDFLAREEHRRPVPGVIGAGYPATIVQHLVASRW
jgi:hypothetical protein